MNLHQPSPQPFHTQASPGTIDWQQQLIRNDDREKSIKAILANVVTCLRNAPEWAGVIAFDEFSSQVVIRGELPWAVFSDLRSSQWSDSEAIRAADWMQREGLFVKPDLVHQAVDIVARENSFHPVRDYIEPLSWDGVQRTKTWLTTIFGVEDTEYARAVGERWLIAAIARIFEPGAKVDNVLILEGAQGIGKSKALAGLCGEWFTDHLPNLQDKDARLQINGKWIIEIAELAGFSKSETNKVKAFLSADRDRFRPPYGRHVVEVPRQCVFAGTTNLTDYLHDETGARRFWPVLCTKADADTLKALRDQLWAEAYQLFSADQKWWLDEPHLIAAAKDQQANRYEGDPWDDLIEPFIASSPSVSVSELLLNAIGMSPERWGQRDKTRIGKILGSRGWQRRQTRNPDGRREWRYFPPDSVKEQPRHVI